MRPIELRAEATFVQALRCVERRLPRARGLRPAGYLLSLGLRYGLIGSAALHHLLLSTHDEEQPAALEAVAAWPLMVHAHSQKEIVPRLPFEPDESVPRVLAICALGPVRAYVPLYRMLCPLDQCLRIIRDEFSNCHVGGVRKGWPWYRWGRACRTFSEEAERSLSFAMNFFERRQAGLEEVPEIALLGE